jgi:hypothetical protein
MEGSRRHAGADTTGDAAGNAPLTTRWHPAVTEEEFKIRVSTFKRHHTRHTDPNISRCDGLFEPKQGTRLISRSTRSDTESQC